MRGWPDCEGGVVWSGVVGGCGWQGEHPHEQVVLDVIPAGLWMLRRILPEQAIVFNAGRWRAVGEERRHQH